mgnify:FL=1
MHRENIAARELTDEEAKVVVEQSQAVIICHAEDNVVVSGTFFFAMSLRKQVIALETPFLAWAAASLPAGYTHVFSDLEALAQSLSHVDPTLTLDTGPIEREYGDDKIKASLKHLYKLQ